MQVVQWVMNLPWVELIMQRSSTQNADEISDKHCCYNIWGNTMVGEKSIREYETRELDSKNERSSEIRKTNHHTTIDIWSCFSTNLRSSLSNLKDDLLFPDIWRGKELTGANLSLIERNCEWMKFKSPPSRLQENEKVSNMNGVAHATQDKPLQS